MSLLILSDSPPLGNEGTGMSVLVHRIVQALEQDAAGLVTRRYSRKFKPAIIGSGLSTKTFLAWDCTSFGLKFLRRNYRYKTDDFLQTLWVKLHRRQLGNGIHEILGLSGPNWHFLKTLADQARVLRCEYSVYIVDDFEETAAKLKLDPPDQVRQRVGFYLRGASRVFTICPGMTERMRELYGVNSCVVYPVADQFRSTSITHNFTSGKVVYVGSLGPTYLPLLVECASLLDRLNAAGADWRLQVLTTDQKAFGPHLSGFGCARLASNLSRAELRGEVASAEVVLLPYTFDPAFEVTTRTSFPSKFMDAVVSGRPVMVYSPAYSSIARHLRENGCDFFADSIAQTESLFATRPWRLNNNWRHSYAVLNQRFHSMEAARRAITGTPVLKKPLESSMSKAC